MLSKREWDTQRKSDLANAIFDRIAEGKRIPEEWTKEYNALIGNEITLNITASEAIKQCSGQTRMLFAQALRDCREDIKQRIKKEYGTRLL